jgi:hypothetical protein
MRLKPTVPSPDIIFPRMDAPEMRPTISISKGFTSLLVFVMFTTKTSGMMLPVEVLMKQFSPPKTKALHSMSGSDEGATKKLEMHQGVAPNA